MKILHIIDSGGLYGAEVMLLNLVAEQVRQGIEPIIASIGEHGIPEKPLETAAVKRGLPLERFRMRPGLNIAGVMKVLRFARAEKVDILHSHGFKGNILFGLMPRFMRRLPLVTTLHGWTWTGGWSRMALYEWLDRLSLSFIDRVVVVSESMRSRVGLKNICVINNGIPINDSTDSNNRVLRTGNRKQGLKDSTNPLDSTNAIDSKIVAFCNGGFTIGAIGRLSKEKGFDILLNAVKQVAETHHHVKLLILGEGGERNDLEATVERLGLGERVLMPGYVKDAKQYLPLFGLFALPSLTEGLPMVILEAMAAGVPIVATRVGGLPDVLGNGEAGSLVEPGNVDALRDGLLKVLDNPENARMKAVTARQRVSDRYSSHSMAASYLEIYRQLLGSVKCEFVSNPVKGNSVIR